MSSIETLYYLMWTKQRNITVGHQHVKEIADLNTATTKLVQADLTTLDALHCLVLTQQKHGIL